MKVIVRTGKSNVFEVALLAVAFIAGLAGLFTGAPEGSALDSIAPGNQSAAFFGLSLFGSTAALVGIYLPARLRPLRWEVTGLVAMAAIWIPYGGALVVRAPSGLAAGCLLVGFGVACILRIVQIRNEVRQSRGLSALITYSERDP